MDTDLVREPLAPQLPLRQRLPSNKRGAPGRHEMHHLRRYTVVKFAGCPVRGEFIFSTVSPFVLELVGRIHADPFDLRPDWSRYTAAEA